MSDILVLGRDDFLWNYSYGITPWDSNALTAVTTPAKPASLFQNGFPTVIQGIFNWSSPPSPISEAPTRLQ